jgi:hypothetical protein
MTTTALPRSRGAARGTRPTTGALRAAFPTRLAGAVVPACVGAVLLSGCSGPPAPGGAPTPSLPAAGPPASPAPRTPAPAGRPRPLPIDRAAVVAEVWFAGLPIGADGGRRVLVTYPALTVTETAAGIAVRLKLPVFSCSGRAPGTRDYRGCRGRRVEYADLAEPGLVAVRGAAGALALTGRFTMYRYGPGIDPGDGRRPSWTGRTVLVRASLSALRPARAASRGLMATGRITVGTASAPAAEDRGYPNVLAGRSR